MKALLPLLVPSLMLGSCFHEDDTTSPKLASVIQNRNIDNSGQTVVFKFTEPLDVKSATNPANYIASGGQTAMTARMLAGSNRTVQVNFNALTLPGTTTFTVKGVRDVNGNKMSAQVARPLLTTDLTPPNATATVGTAVTNGANDTITVTFDDFMVASDVLALANYTLTHLGAPALNGSTFSYDEPSRTLTITLNQTAAAAVNLQFGVGYVMSFVGLLRDLGGNALVTAAIGSTVVGDGTAPTVVSATQT
ncbi:MAG TPA: Ig-like domain-containing protein, partial [Planctomycetota bacterium]